MTDDKEELLVTCYLLLGIGIGIIGLETIIRMGAIEYGVGTLYS